MGDASRRSVWRPVLGTALAALLLAALWAWVQRQAAAQGVDLGEQVLRIPWQAWAVLTVALTLSYALRASRMHAELGRVRPVRWSTVWGMALQHNAMVNLMPMRTGELAYPILLKRRLGIDTAASVASLLWMRMQDACVLLALVVVLMAPGPVWARWLCVALGAAFTVGVVRVLRRFFRGTAPWPSTRWGRLVGLLWSEEKHSRASWLWGAANWGVKIAGVATFLAWSVPLPAEVAGPAGLGGELAALIPLQGPAGLGTYESAVWAAVRWHTPEVPASLPVVTLAMHLWMVAQALLFGLVAWTWNQWKKNDASE